MGGGGGGAHSSKSAFAIDATRSIRALSLQKHKVDENLIIANFKRYPTSIRYEKLSNSNICMGASSVSAMQHLNNILCVTFWYD